jgi:NAD-dependent dihydropyrimidine dehydrogenase PreA subunit
MPELSRGYLMPLGVDGELAHGEGCRSRNGFGCSLYTASKLAEVCPVDIFAASEDGLKLVEENLDECTLCDLCKEAFPGKVEVKKLYEE